MPMELVLMKRASAASGEERKADSSPLKWFGMTKGFEVQKIYQVYKVMSVIRGYEFHKKVSSFKKRVPQRTGLCR